jgi:hypothetical protein
MDQIKIVSISIIRRRNNSDKLFLHTELPQCIYPFSDTASLVLDVMANVGEEYIKKHFPNTPYKVITD